MERRHKRREEAGEPRLVRRTWLSLARGPSRKAGFLAMEMDERGGGAASGRGTGAGSRVLRTEGCCEGALAGGTGPLAAGGAAPLLPKTWRGEEGGGVERCVFGEYTHTGRWCHAWPAKLSCPAAEKEGDRTRAHLCTNGLHPALHFHPRLRLQQVCPLRHDDLEGKLHLSLVVRALVVVEGGIEKVRG